MKKNTVIYLVAGIVALIIIGLSIYFAVAHNNTSDNRYDTKNITIEKYNENGELEKTVEIKRKKDITARQYRVFRSLAWEIMSYMKITVSEYTGELKRLKPIR